MMMGYEDVVVAGYHDPVGSTDPVCRCEPPYPHECPGRGVTLAEFLLSRITEDETDALAVHSSQAITHGDYESDAVGRLVTRVLAECEAKRRIIEWHQNWPVFVEGPPELGQPIGADVHRAQFGDEPPTSPILLMLAQPYAGRPDFRDEWRL